jgi:hypothetical protein
MTAGGNRMPTDGADRGTSPGSVPSRRLVLVDVHLAGIVFGDDRGVVGADGSRAVEVLDDVVVGSRRRLARVSADKQEYRVGLCHFFSP